MTMEFWADTQQWPRDSKDYVFLARAIHEIGRAMHGSAWTGNEFTDEADPAIARLALVFKDFLLRCESSELKSGYRGISGGDIRPIPSSWWNTEKIGARFEMCQLNPKSPFSSEVSGDGHAWIFISRSSLDQYIRNQPFAAQPADLKIYLSPYMRVMVTVARKLEISPQHQPKKEEVIAALRKEWTGKGAISTHLVETMATLLREPESQLGRARKSDKG
jgi:hypothetical protein